MKKSVLPLSVFFIAILINGTSLFGQTVVQFTTSGTFTAPPCVTSVQVQTWGAGGGGAGSLSGFTNNAGGGGGGGAYNMATLTVTPGNLYTVTVGVGGTASSGNNGGTGGSSSFNGSVVAAGGSGGTVWNNIGAGNGTGGAGGSGGIYSGGNGNGGDHPNYGGGGGGGAGSGGNGGNAGSPTAATAGTGGPGAQAGGTGGTGSSTTGATGSAPGGGGSGSLTLNPLGSSQSGGAGANGQVIITYTVPLPTVTGVTGTGCPGSTVTINGTNLSGATAVTIGATAVTNLNITGTVITGTIAAGTSSGIVSVTTPCGTATSASSFTVHPSIPPVSLGTHNICAGSGYSFGGHLYTTAGTFSDTVASAVTGCDSITTVTLTVAAVINQAISHTMCQGNTYSFGGQVYASSGVFIDTATSAVTGCDSITTLTLTVTPVTPVALAQTICAGSSYSFGGHSYTSAGVYGDTTVSAGGCDSITVLTLTVTPVTPVAISQSICAGNTYSFGGHSYSAAGVYADTTTAVSGCDSITVLTLTVTPVVPVAISQTICAGGSYSFGGHSYSTSGIYSDTVAVAGGCDSITVLTLTVGGNLSATITDSICNGASFTFNGTTYTTPGTWSDTLHGAGTNGCDSVVTLILSLKSGSASTVTASALIPIFCSGDSTQICATAGFVSYIWNNHDTRVCTYATSAGNFYVTATDANGCTVTSNHVSVSTYQTSSISISVNGDTLTCYTTAACQWYFNGHAMPGATTTTVIVHQTGNYSVEITDSNGCHYTSSATPVSVGINNVQADVNFNVYPNPLSNGSWHLAVSENLVGSLCEIFDANGRIVFQSSIRNPQSELDLNTAKGVYVMQIHAPDANYYVRLVKLN